MGNYTTSFNNLYVTSPYCLCNYKNNFKQFQNRTYATLQSVVDEGIDQGDFANIKPELFMKAVGGIFHGIVFMGDQKKLNEKDIESLITNLIYPS